jgi:hypothetical protein
MAVEATASAATAVNVMKVFRSISLPPYGKIALKRIVQETSQFPKSAAPNLDGALRMREFLTKNSWLATKKLPAHD